MNPLIFREYDIRGIVDTDLTDDVVRNIGKAFGSVIRREGKKTVTIGGDCRLSTERFRKDLIEGIVSTGCDVLNLGICTTPILYFSIYTLDVDGGIMITGSHNPSDFNGFKMCVGKETIHGADIKKIHAIIEDNDFESGSGTAKDYDVITAYKKYMVSKFSFKRPVKVAIDAGNGTGGEIFIPILNDLGVDVVPLNCQMDGTFPNHHPDPTVEKNLIQLIDAVKKQSLDLGIAFDGDSDRIGAVNEKGEIIWGDKLMILFSRAILKANPGATIISEVKSSTHLYADIEKNGGNGIMWKTGHSLIKAKMKETNAALAGEMSGHVFFADRYYGFDDAIYAALRLIEIVDRSDEPLSAMLSDVPKTFSTAEIRVDCPDELKFKIVEAIKDDLKNDHTIIDIDGVRIVFDDGWGLIRASNTQAVLVMRFEADSNERLKEMRSFVENKVAEISGRFK
jgi:phosphomannomutase / phosphoglucomutase